MPLLPMYKIPLQIMNAYWVCYFNYLFFLFLYCYECDILRFYNIHSCNRILLPISYSFIIEIITLQDSKCKVYICKRTITARIFFQIFWNRTCYFFQKLPISTVNFCFHFKMLLKRTKQWQNSSFPPNDVNKLEL